ncbi:siderophore-interacting protein [Mycobacterium yunnanensis]|uniref:Siderophore-interacting protein n=1 Tax=Mycobacterium yunnanensis TaxID=368477 RepID=A0A9X3C1V5_9MYCO|nr:siderophore-interacting protein [Mycobacterium yunnanensis]MCV7421718.1 siderophore-interacting protein [Mycobacterium yunnanensis]
MATLANAIPFYAAVRDALVLAARVDAVDHLTPTMRRIRLRGPRLEGLTWTPGQHVRVQVAGFRESLIRLRVRDTLRTYSIYQADPDEGTLDIVMFDHAHPSTPAKRWAAGVSVGDEVTFGRPEGKFVVRPDASHHVFAGDETASVAFAAMLRALPAGAEVHGVIEGESGATPLPLSRHLTHVERAGTAADSAVLADAVRGLRLPRHPGVAYLAGEARTVQRLRSILVEERGWDRRHVVTKPFWTPGRVGMD